MGSVRDLYTTGDNDPQIETEQYYRHYLYCDACGSFELAPWTRGDRESGERKRHLWAMAALTLSPLVVVALWSAFGLVLSPVLLLALAAGMVIAPVLRGWVSRESAARRWRFVKWALPAIGMLLVAAELVPAILPPWPMLGGGALLIALLLLAREWVKPSFDYLGLTCRRCGATYASGSPFFTELGANPRQLKVEDVPRPLGSSPFERGESEPSPAHRQATL